MKLAVTGKGGVGKTTIVGTLARLLARPDQQVLALDADSNPNLAGILGLPRAATITPLPAELTEWREDAEGHAYVHLRRPLAQVIADYGVPAPDHTCLLVMGQVEHAGVGCRCSAHAAARGITHHLMTEAAVAVLDMEAGLEHLGRGTVEHVDLLLIVVEPYYRALETATRAHALAAQLGVPRIRIVANRIRTPQDQEAVARYCQAHDLDLIASIPFDDAVVRAEQQGQAPLDHAPHSPAMAALRDLVAQVRVLCA